MKTTNPHLQLGSSMIEILVALTLVSVTMLGLLALQLRSQALNKDSFDRRTAALIASDFGERVQANYAGFTSGHYAGLTFTAGSPLPTAPSACAVATLCSPQDIRNRDWWNLQHDVRARLPGGVAFVDAPPLVAGGAAPARVNIVVGWIDTQRRQEFSGTGGVVGSFLADPVCSSVGITDTSYRCYVASVYP